MLLTMRVVLTILFSAFVLWSQTLDAEIDTVSAAVDSEQLKHPAIVVSDKWPEPQTRDPFTFKLGLPQRSPDVSKFVFAMNSAFPSEPQTASSQAPPSRPKAFSYSNGYFVRRKIHKYASIATLPLAVSEAVVGQKLMDRTGDGSGSLRSAHSALTTGIGVLFGIESVTGIWNMWEARKNPKHRGKRLFHGILMLAADAGFVATAALAPGDDDGDEGKFEGSTRASTHRAVAFTSLGVAAFSYIYMLFAK